MSSWASQRDATAARCRVLLWNAGGPQLGPRGQRCVSWPCTAEVLGATIFRGSLLGARAMGCRTRQPKAAKGSQEQPKAAKGSRAHAARERRRAAREPGVHVCAGLHLSALVCTLLCIAALGNRWRQIAASHPRPVTRMQRCALPTRCTGESSACTPQFVAPPSATSRQLSECQMHVGCQVLPACCGNHCSESRARGDLSRLVHYICFGPWRNLRRGTMATAATEPREPHEPVPSRNAV
jgi:hypothetical protein